MPKLLHARVPEDPGEESEIRKLAASRHAPGDWILRARIVSLSWQGLRTAKIAEELGCHPKTVRKRLHRFNAEGISGLGDRSGAGRKPRITEEDGRFSRSRPGDGYRGRTQPGEAHPASRGGALAPDATVGRERRSGVRPKRSKIVGLYTDPPPDSTVVCVDELDPVTPRAFPPAPGWSPDGRRIKAPLQYSRGPDKAWVFGALRVEDGKALTFASRSRNSKSYLRLLEKIERAIPKGLIYLIADNLKTHKSAMVREWLEKHPRIEHAFIPKGAAWLNLIGAWWRMFRRQALARVDFADSYEIGQAARVATRQLNRKAKP